MQYLGCFEECQQIVRLMQSESKDEVVICEETQRLARLNTDLRDILQEISLDTREIKWKWDANRTEAANRGTWMHYQMERWINWAPACVESEEMAMLLKFTRQLGGLTAYRTEWAIFAEAERLAGSIDCVATDASGRLLIFDWKRSRDLRAKYSSPFNVMLYPCEHLDDCQGNHYRLQLNCYKYMLEKYYGKVVSGTYVVCVRILTIKARHS